MMIELLLVCLLTVSYVLDFHSIYIRSHNSAKKIGEFLALANLVQYLSRILIVITIFIISILTETKHKNIDFSLIFSLASFLATILLIIIIHNEKIANMICIIIKPAIILSFRNIANQQYWRIFTRKIKMSLMISSFSVNSLALTASFLPFLIAEFIPQYRMTSVYAGQLLNFCATAIVLTMLDPKAMRLLSTGSADEARSSILLGRITSHVLASFVLGIMALK